MYIDWGPGVPIPYSCGCGSGWCATLPQYLILTISWAWRPLLRWVVQTACPWELGRSLWVQTQNGLLRAVTSLSSFGAHHFILLWVYVQAPIGEFVSIIVFCVIHTQIIHYFIWISNYTMGMMILKIASTIAYNIQFVKNCSEQ